MQRTTYLRLLQLTAIIVAWMFIGFMIAIYDHLLLHANISRGPSSEYTFLSACIRNVGAGLIAAILGGGFLIFYINVKFQNKPYRYTIVAVIISFILIVATITLIMAVVIVPLRTERPVSDPVTLEAIKNFMIDTAPVKALVVWFFVVLVTQVFLLMNAKFGYGTFWHFVSGKYNVPKVEGRVFMFLDINASTSLAETMGSEKYHSFLRDFFADITDPVINHFGSISQYVGDEVVISWPLNNCRQCAYPLLCFLQIKTLFREKQEKYLRRYGINPSFKAGIHAGDVVTGEVGIVKRDVTHSGDVLNATARIRDLCKEFNTDLLVSENFLTLIQENNSTSFVWLGKIRLRGKEQELNLYAVQT
jgi:adenylate cyclase